jgi:transketolase
MVAASLKAADLLEEEGLSCTVVDMHTIKPLDEAVIDEYLKAKLLVTVEEHSVIGGLGGAVAECLALKKERPPHLLIGIAEGYPHAGDYAYMLEKSGLTPVQIAERIKANLQM